MQSRIVHRLTCGLALCGALALVAPAVAQPASTPKPAVQTVAVPSFWDPRRRPERPDLTRLAKVIRFLTETDYPPFNFALPDGAPQARPETQ